MEGLPALDKDETITLMAILKQSSYSSGQANYISELHQKYTGQPVCLTCGGKLRSAMRYLLGIKK